MNILEILNARKKQLNAKYKNNPTVDVRSRISELDIIKRRILNEQKRCSQDIGQSEGRTADPINYAEPSPETIGILWGKLNVQK